MNRNAQSKKRSTTSGQNANNNSNSRVPNVVVAVRPTLSTCTAHYIRALTNPFDSFPSLPCIPDFISFPSQKIKMDARGVFKANGLGFGCIVLQPWVFDKERVMGMFTTGNYIGSHLPFYTSTNTEMVYNNNPYSDFLVQGDNFSHRLVGCGLRVRYIGPENERAGRMILARLPGSQTLYNPGAEGTPAPTPATLLSDQRFTTTPVTRGWQTVAYYPDSSNLLSYVRGDATEEVTYGNPVSLAIVVDGATASSAFEFEVVQFFEATFNGAPNLSVSHSDPVGLAAAISSLPKKMTGEAKQAENSLLDRALSSLTDNFSGLLPTIMDTTQKVALRYMAGYLGNAISGGARTPVLRASRPIVTEL